jgi:hypothetical protein
VIHHSPLALSFLPCSKTFSLPQGKLLSHFGLVKQESLLDVPNAALGILYYNFILLAGGIAPAELILFASCMAMLSSIYLAYTLTALRELCLLCWSTHVINSILLWNGVRRVKQSNLSSKKQQ